MKVSEKSLELNVGAELLNVFRNDWGLSKVYLRGLTQSEEKKEGVDFFAQLNPATRLFAFEFKAPKGLDDTLPYRYTLRREQHDVLFQLTKSAKNSVFYVFPYYIKVLKLQRDVPDLMKDTWLLELDYLRTTAVFGTATTKTIRCRAGVASVNPDYELRRIRELPRPHGVPARDFAEWYGGWREVGARLRHRRDPWLVRGLRVAIVLPET